MNDHTRITDLTVGELKKIIYSLVQESVTEVLLEFSIAAQHDADLMYQAEMNDLLRTSIQERLHGVVGFRDAEPAYDD